MERTIDLPGGDRLWTEAHGDPATPAVLLIMGANASGVAWPDALVARLAEAHRVIRYDHRDTGRSTWRYDEDPYPLTALAGDAIAVLDAHAVDRAHVVGMSLGGLLTQLLLLDAPGRVASATLLGTGPLAGVPGQPEAPGPREDLLAVWQTMGDPRTPEADAAWQLEHWRLLNGPSIAFDPQEFTALDMRVAAHAGGRPSTYAHARADQSGFDRGAELAGVGAPVLVVDAPEDPAFPPPNPALLAAAIPGARLVTIPGMGHALPAAVVPPLADAILGHTAG
ncbi:Rhodomycin D methylesterase DauP [Paraconexibacter sp. AEG42_29]|uniref:Rhodomycin D methylesterase DauP n=1 Tax=Paraconexibacter sp. AEG42_29 TaxID=2997339 RepID=A0AAU7AU62_9ACTN